MSKRDSSTVEPLVAFGGALLVLSALHRPKPQPQPMALDMTVPSEPAPQIQGWQNRDFTFGVASGAVAMGLAWYVWKKGKPKIYSATRPEYY